MRRTGIGSSDIAAIADQDPHRKPVDVWLDKLGKVQSLETPAQDMGHRIEPVIAAWYCDKTGAHLVDGHTVRHHDHTWALATPDRLALRGPAPVVELKNVGWQWAHLWGEGPEEIPAEKYIQVQWQLEVLDKTHADIAALIGGNDPRTYRIWRDTSFGLQLLELADSFWHEHVLADVPPPHDGAAAQKLAALRWPKSKGDVLAATIEAEILRAKLRRVHRAEKLVKDLRNRYEARAKALIGDADGVEGCFTWRSDKNGTRVFLLKQEKNR
jgi:putative phage-type endonuclease